MNRTLLFIFIALGMLVSACGDSEDAAFISSLSIKNGSGVETVDFHGGQEATVTLTVQNLSPEPQVIETPSHQYAVFVLNSSGGLEWDSTYGIGIPTVVTYQVFGSQGARTYESTWGLADITNTPVPPGQYYVQGYLGVLDEFKRQSEGDYDPSEFRSPMVEVTVY
jgi:hypothetical protein